MRFLRVSSGSWALSVQEAVAVAAGQSSHCPIRRLRPPRRDYIPINSTFSGMSTMNGWWPQYPGAAAYGWLRRSLRQAS